MNSIELDLTSSENPSSWKDLVGIAASIGCAIHCAAMPFVIAYLPALGLSFLADEAFHKWMALVCFLIAIAAFLPGLRKHGNWLPVGIGSAGLVLITFAAFGLAGECCPSCAAADSSTHQSTNKVQCSSDCDHCEHCGEDEAIQPATTVSASSSPSDQGLLVRFAPWITPFGGMLLVAAHLFNRRCGYLCGCCAQVA